MSDKCPKCGAEVDEGDHYAYQVAYICDSGLDKYNHFHESYQCLRNQNTSLQAVVDKLPKTADGVPIVPQMQIWYRFNDTIHEDMVLGLTAEVAWSHLIAWNDCYSAREAAEAAKGGG